MDWFHVKRIFRKPDFLLKIPKFKGFLNRSFGKSEIETQQKTQKKTQILHKYESKYNFYFFLRRICIQIDSRRVVWRSEIRKKPRRNLSTHTMIRNVDQNSCLMSWSNKDIFPKIVLTCMSISDNLIIWTPVLNGFPEVSFSSDS